MHYCRIALNYIFFAIFQNQSCVFCLWKLCILFMPTRHPYMVHRIFLPLWSQLGLEWHQPPLFMVVQCHHSGSGSGCNAICTGGVHVVPTLTQIGKLPSWDQRGKISCAEWCRFCIGLWHKDVSCLMYSVARLCINQQQWSCIYRGQQN